MNIESAWPRELMPTTVQKFLVFVPLTYVVNLLCSLWIGNFWSSTYSTWVC